MKILYAVMAILGVLVILAEIGLHIAAAISPTFSYELNHVVLIAGAIIGFWGLFQVEPKGAKEIAGIIADVLPKFGRRSTDAVAVPEAETTVKAVPVTSVPRDEADGFEPTP